MESTNFFKNFYMFFRDGFASMTIGKTLWMIVLIKLFIMFGILKVFFFPNFLNSTFDNDADKANHVRTELIEKASPISPKEGLNDGKERRTIQDKDFPK